MSAWLLLLAAPLLGGLVYGAERMVRARMQNRQGPPLLQPFYDLFKLADKRPMVVHSFHAMLGVLHFFAVWFALAILLFGGDILMAVFIHLLASALLITAAFSAPSVYSQLGGFRELVTVLAYEPIYILAAVGLYLVQGSFMAGSAFSASEPSLWMLWPLFLALLIVMPAKLKKSPFDVSEAHQELIGGPEIEFSGIFYEALYTARWLEYIYAYLFLLLFTGANLWLGAGVVIGVFFLINLVDNATARITYPQMVRGIYATALPLAVGNLLYLSLGGA